VLAALFSRGCFLRLLDELLCLDQSHLREFGQFGRGIPSWRVCQQPALAEPSRSRIAESQIIGILSSGRVATATCRSSCARSPSRTPSAHTRPIARQERAPYTRVVSSRSRFRRTINYGQFCATWNARALRANLPKETAAWRRSSLWHRVHGDEAGLLDEGPLPLPRGWLQHVQSPQTEAELETLRRWSAAYRLARRLGRRGQPGRWAWNRRSALGVGHGRLSPSLNKDSFIRSSTRAKT
jgi:hypothetical protein